MHNLSASFVLGYHGCDAAVAEDLLRNRSFVPSKNAYDWLGSGIYFWEANPLRGLEFAREASRRKPKTIRIPTVVGAVIDLGYCLDLTTSRGLQATKTAFTELQQIHTVAGDRLPENYPNGALNYLDCKVLNHLHYMQAVDGKPAFDTVKGVFIESPPLYEGSAFGVKNHIQIAVRNPTCIKGVFRVPDSHLDPNA